MRKHALAILVMFVLAAVALAQAKPKPAAKTAAGPHAVPAADVKWVDLDPTGAPGVKISDMWGDHTKGAFGSLVKFPAGFTTPLHTHTNAFKIVVISGTFVQVPEGGKEIRLGPGSYLMQPGDGYKHTSGCDKASDCVFFTQANGKFDLIPVK